MQPLPILMMHLNRAKKRWLLLLTTLFVLEALVRLVVHSHIMPQQTDEALQLYVAWHSEGKRVRISKRASWVNYKPDPEYQNLNPEGFHSPEILRERPPGVKRIAFLGSSSTYNIGPVEETYPHACWQQLLESGIRLDYLNAGVPGYTSTSTLVNYHLRVEPYRPDLVVFYNGRNDLMAASNNTYSYFDRTEQALNDPVVVPGNGHQLASTISYTYALACEALGVHALRNASPTSRLRDDADYRREQGVPETMDMFIENVQRADLDLVYHRNVEALALLTQANGSQLLLCGFAFNEQLVNPSANFMPHDREPTERERGILKSRLQALNTALESIAQQYDHVQYLDLSGQIPAHLFKDDCHLLLEGKQLQAQLVADFISSNQLLQKP